MEKTCRNCRHSQFARKNEYGEIVTLPKGFCRRFPPQYALRGTWGDYTFPQVDADDWCGEWAVVLPHQAKEADSVKDQAGNQSIKEKEK